jgi:transcriptional regulator with XRE-family HTH domain
VAKKSAQAEKRIRWRKAAASVIAQTRKDADFSQSKLGAAVGWSRNKQQKLESGVLKIEHADIEMIAEALGASADEMIRRTRTWFGKR